MVIVSTPFLMLSRIPLPNYSLTPAKVAKIEDTIPSNR